MSSPAGDRKSVRGLFGQGDGAEHGAAFVQGFFPFHVQGFFMPGIFWRIHLPVARGFIPVGVRSGPETNHRGVSGKPRAMVLRLLRSRAGINPLATMNPTPQINPHPTHVLSRRGSEISPGFVRPGRRRGTWRGVCSGFLPIPGPAPSRRRCRHRPARAVRRF
jgi:hypothetical protein